MLSLLSVCPHPCKAWRKKIPERSEDDFFPDNQPGRAALRELRGKQLFLQQEMRMLSLCLRHKKRGTPYCMRLPKTDGRIYVRYVCSIRGNVP
ncbi:hypothetical protein DW701_11620 [Bacteroides eggerthii]|uniref:KaiA C-terminal domain-containing protein n=1 Tax=Bacteroides eggerthii TaxID=28111 RepID=A0A414M9C4_9BACE|nr:hypothetical protein DW701_11620 [Bacteroides eggerthii]